MGMQRAGTFGRAGTFARAGTMDQRKSVFGNGTGAIFSTNVQVTGGRLRIPYAMIYKQRNLGKS